MKFPTINIVLIIIHLYNNTLETYDDILVHNIKIT